MKPDTESNVVRLFLTPSTFVGQMRQVRRAVRQWLAEGARVEIRPKKETRRDVQNRLLHRWCGQLDKADGHERGYSFAIAKLDLLLPMKLADDHEHERAMHERRMIDGGVAYMIATDESGDINARELRVYAAEDIVRSSTIRVRLFAEWLTAIQRQAAERGIALYSLQEEREMALYEQHVNTPAAGRGTTKRAAA